MDGTAPVTDSRVNADSSLRPWQFFVLAALGLATAVTFMVRGQGLIPVIMLSVLMGTTAIAGIAALRLFRPLVSDEEDRTPMIGARTRAALEREKMLALRAIKDLDFDHAMGKLSDSDWKEMSGRLRTRATRLLRQLDAGAGYRAQIERDVAKRLAAADVQAPADHAHSGPPSIEQAETLRSRICAACSTANDPDARFCKRCGEKLGG
jgi:ribosomal protein L40E